MIFLKCTTG